MKMTMGERARVEPAKLVPQLPTKQAFAGGKNEESGRKREQKSLGKLEGKASKALQR